MPLQLQNPFDARQVDPSAGFSLVPAGDYTVRIVESEAKATTSDPNQGKLELQLEILEGQFAGQKLFLNLNLFNKSQQATEIAYRQLSALCHVTGVFNLQNTQQLHGIPFKVNVSNDGQYNNVKGFMDMSGNRPGKGSPQAAAPQAPAAHPAVAVAPAPQWPAPPQQAAPAPAAPAWGPPMPAAQPAAPQWATAPAPQQPQPQAPQQQQFAPPAAAQPPATPPWAQSAPAPAAAPTWKP